VLENRRFLIPLSVISLGLSVFFQRLGTDVIPKVDFVQGMLLGISLGISVLALILEAVVRHYE